MIGAPAACPSGLRGRIANLSAADHPDHTDAEHSQDLTAESADTDAARLARSLAFIVAESPELRLIADRWADLPEPIRAAIVAMVKATDTPA